MKYLYLLFIIVSFNCKGQKDSKMTHKYTNDLINESSPYLLQHAHNPVDWKPWKDETLELAKKENKLLVISVGYAACHWCHVMEHESFENDSVAKVMNSHFINIKVDREERPDVDQVYMSAVQLMTGQGGWPLNVIALPDGRPVFGGTYFKKDQWVDALEQIQTLYKNDPKQLTDYAKKLEQGIHAMAAVDLKLEPVPFNNAYIKTAIETWQEHFDKVQGGVNRAPKFMMPNNYHFLMRYAHQKKELELKTYVETTLKNMAYGGVYDHIGGGFSRYSTDEKWHVPHFEKMLYDNAQLVSLYADAFAISKANLYKHVVEESLEFVARELTAPNGAFYSSLDADSKTSNGALEEGAFYVWTKAELKKVLDTNAYKLFSEYYNINTYGHWEHNNYVLIRKESDTAFVKKHALTLAELEAEKAGWKAVLLKERSKRQRPRLDDKVLTSWNALMLKGYVDAYRVFNNPKYLECAKKNATFLLNNQLKKDGGLYHNFKNGKSTINGYLEDYATTIDAFIALYETTLDETWLHQAKKLADYSFDYFFNAENKMFYFTSSTDSKLISRTVEYQDNVIPSSNSMIAKNLFKLSHYFDNTHYYKTAISMLNNVSEDISNHPSAFSNWLDLMLNVTEPFYEIAVVGKDAKQKIKALNTHYIPNKLVAGSVTENNLPLLKDRYTPDNTYIYVCVNKSCKRPVTELKTALELMD